MSEGGERLEHHEARDSAVRDRGGDLGGRALRDELALAAVAEDFDLLAWRYDEEYSKPWDRDEDTAVLRALVSLPVTAPVVDLGCGTGKFLELRPGFDSTTTGFDLSGEMLARARRKFPESTFIHEDMFEATGMYMTVVSLFGSPSYAPFGRVCDLAHRLLFPGGRAILMPLHLSRADNGRPVPAASQARYFDEGEALSWMDLAGFGATNVSRIGNFVVVSGRKPWA